MEASYDLVVIGGGTGGLVAALIAAGIGARVALVERDRLGGDCLWTGCVPSKSLLAAAELAHLIRHADGLGLTPSEPAIDFSRVMERVRRAVTTIEAHESAERLQRDGVSLIRGHARFTGRGRLVVDARPLRFRAAIIATGSRPVVPSVPGLTDAPTLTTDTVWQLERLPERLVILGGGPIGCEFAQAFVRLGAAVTVVELSQRLLPREEPAASRLLADRLTAEGVQIRLDAQAERFESASGHSEVVLAGGERLPADAILLAVGRVPRSTGLGLETVGVATDPRGAVLVDEHLRTSARGIYAVGDVTGLLQFTHVAAHHARVAVPNALFHAGSRRSETIPWVTFTDPEVARVGLTEAEARERWGDRARVAGYEYAELDRAITSGQAYGFAKLIADPRGRLVGATIAAPAAGEALGEVAALIARGGRMHDLSRAVHAYPTLAEGPVRAADDDLAARYSTPGLRRLASLVFGGQRLWSRLRGR